MRQFQRRQTGGQLLQNDLRDEEHVVWLQERSRLLEDERG